MIFQLNFHYLSIVSACLDRPQNVPGQSQNQWSKTVPNCSKLGGEYKDRNDRNTEYYSTNSFNNMVKERYHAKSCDYVVALQEYLMFRKKSCTPI